jgi:Cu/Zn superoxide dismutase
MEQTHSWETCKENVQPIKRGRSIKGLGQGATVERLEALEEQEAAFERGIAGISDSKLLLDAYVQYFKWTRDAFPSSSDKAQQLLERATAELSLKNNAEVKNEPRFVKMWIEYADMVRTPGEIFSFMQSNKIGERVALFWIAWAFVAEKAENFKLTDQIFQKGLQKVSTLKERERHDEALISRARGEKELLSKRYHQFQRRLARHYINQASDAAATSDEQQSDRIALGGLRSGDAVRQATDENAIRGFGNAPRGNEAASAAQPAIPAARSAAFSSTIASTFASSRASSSSNNFEIFSDAPPSTTPRQASDSAVVGAGFQIFSDDVLPQLAENPSWKQFAPQHVSRKENEGRTTKWTEGGLGGSVAAAPGYASFATQPPPPPPPGPPTVFIPIFCDPEPEPASKQTVGSAREVVEDEQRSGGIRFDLDRASRGRGCGLSAAQHNHILHDPLQRHKEKDTAPALAVPSSSSSSSTTIPRKQPAVSAAVVVAMASPATVVARNSAAPLAPASSGFHIYADSPAPAPTKPAAAPASVSMPNNRHDQSELDALLGEMGILDADAEDGTINTKIARQHIDALFFSPSQSSPSGSALISATGGAPSTGQHSGKLFSAFNTTIDLSAIKEVSVLASSLKHFLLPSFF